MRNYISYKSHSAGNNKFLLLDNFGNKTMPNEFLGLNIRCVNFFGFFCKELYLVYYS